MYEMNPETDVVMFARDLQDGMVVNLEAPGEEVDDEWLEVTKFWTQNDRIYFVAVEGDRFQSTRTYDIGRGFVVRKDSIPVPKVPEQMVLPTMSLELRGILQRWGLTETEALNCLAEFDDAGALFVRKDRPSPSQQQLVALKKAVIKSTQEDSISEDLDENDYR